MQISILLTDRNAFRSFLENRVFGYPFFLEDQEANNYLGTQQYLLGFNDDDATQFGMSISDQNVMDYLHACTICAITGTPFPHAVAGTVESGNQDRIRLMAHKLAVLLR